MQSNYYFDIFTAISNANIIVKIILLILVLMSIYSWGLIFNKIKAIRSKTAIVVRLRKMLKTAKTDFAQLLENFSAIKNNPYLNVLKFLDSNKESLLLNGQLNQPVVDTVYNFLYDINEPVERKITSLATIGNVAPFVGLFGTVVGIINSFGAIGSSSSASLSVIAPGVAEALYATAIGLFVAVPAVFAYNSFAVKIEKFKDQQSILLQEMVFFIVKQNLKSENKKQEVNLKTNREGIQSSFISYQQKAEAGQLENQSNALEVEYMENEEDSRDVPLSLKEMQGKTHKTNIKDAVKVKAEQSGKK